MSDNQTQKSDTANVPSSPSQSNQPNMKPDTQQQEKSYSSDNDKKNTSETAKTGTNS